MELAEIIMLVYAKDLLPAGFIMLFFLMLVTQTLAHEGESTVTILSLLLSGIFTDHLKT